ncbi:MAG: Gfo/Idh/MocA family oxidoreductase [Treponema sp.]|nr:Gfo/Idh/MocA family oxidoreductase [Treponema sp.]
MQNSFDACIIGTGRIGFLLGFDKKREQPASHTMALKNNSWINLCAGCDVNSERLALWKKYNKLARIYKSIDELFENENSILGKKIDIVVIAVNEDNHLSVTLKAIEYKPRLIILEKPVALNVKDALFIKDTAIKKNVPILINHERRFALDYNAAKNYLKQIGKVQNVTACLHSGLRVYCAEEENTGLYSLIHDGTHLVDIVNFLLENEKGQCNLIPENEGKNFVSGVFRDEKNMVRNAIAHYKLEHDENLISVNFLFSGRSKFFGFEIDILGTEGRVQIGNGFFKFWKNKESNLYTGFKSLTKMKIKKYKGKTKYFSQMVQNAVDFLKGKAELKSTIDDGINALKILEAIKEELK